MFFIVGRGTGHSSEIVPARFFHLSEHWGGGFFGGHVARLIRCRRRRSDCLGGGGALGAIRRLFHGCVERGQAHLPPEVLARQRRSSLDVGARDVSISRTRKLPSHAGIGAGPFSILRKPAALETWSAAMPSSGHPLAGGPSSLLAFRGGVARIPAKLAAYVCRVFANFAAWRVSVGTFCSVPSPGVDWNGRPAPLWRLE